MSPPTAYLLILSEREALAWVLRHSRMAFPITKRPEVDRLQVGDRLFIVTTRGCWHNPNRDRTRVIGSAVATTPVMPYESPVSIAGRDFTRGCDMEIHQLTAYRTGVELAELVPQLHAFPDKRVGAWSLRLRRPLLFVDSRDTTLIERALDQMASRPEVVIPEYLLKIRPVASNIRRT
ncbi:hypothetical protein [Nocardia sp. CA-120079]|uniref:hypothetical protein n=1 Tax=Nocardia sp. CA-120079 TaxID=3239974 RepID=UPI003D98C803